MNDRNILCTMTGYYHNKLVYDGHLHPLTEDIMRDMFRYRVTKPLSMVNMNPDTVELGAIIPVRTNLVMKNNAYSVEGVSILQSNDSPFPGDFIDEWEDMYDYKNLNDNDYHKIIYRTIIRGICKEFGGFTDCSPYNMEDRSNCRSTLRRVMKQFAGVYQGTTINIDDKLYYSTDGRIIQIYVWCDCDRQEKNTVFCATPTGVHLTTLGNIKS